MALKLLDTSTGKWDEERLLLWSAVALLQKQQRKQKRRAKKQIDAAHAKIRALQAWKWKAWAASAAASFLGVVVIELLRLLFAKR
jgi:hypothetical protein